MKLREKILIPVIIILAIAVGVAGIYGYIQAKEIALLMADSQMKSSINTVEKNMNERLEMLEVTKTDLNRKYIAITKSIANMIAINEDVLRAENMKNLAKELEIEEIHITDEDGIIRYGTVEEFYGFDFSSNEQTKPFLKALRDRSFTLAQEPQERGADGEMFQYIGVSRIDKPGIVQIGVNPDTVSYLMSDDNIQKVIEGMKIGENGYVYVTNMEGIVIAHPNEDDIGVDIKDYDWGQRILEGSEEIFSYAYEGEEKYVDFRKTSDHITIATYPASDYNKYINKLRINIIIMLLVAVGLSILIISLLITKQVTRPINKLVETMGKAGNGDLTSKLEFKSKDEIGLLGTSFNKMSDNIKDLLQRVQKITLSSKETSGVISNSAEEMGASSSEIARTIQEMASGATQQAEEAVNGVNLTNTLAEKIDSVANRSKSAIEDAGYMKENNEFGIKSIVNLKEKFANNNKAAQEVAKSIGELSDKSQSIDNIVSTITGIAEQTNLLALNAAIEAARAGESGRGFAVVAEEVRKLAEQSGNAAQEIKNIIDDIRGVINKTGETMEYAGKIVEEVNVSLEDTSGSFNEIKTSSDKLLENIDMLFEDVEAMNQAKDSVMAIIENISAITEESAASTQQVSASAEEQTATLEEVVSSIQELDDMIEKLNQSVKIFKI